MTSGIRKTAGKPPESLRKNLWVWHRLNFSESINLKFVRLGVHDSRRRLFNPHGEPDRSGKGVDSETVYRDCVPRSESPLQGYISFTRGWPKGKVLYDIFLLTWRTYVGKNPEKALSSSPFWWESIFEECLTPNQNVWGKPTRRLLQPKTNKF